MSSNIKVTRDDVDRLYSFAFSKRLEKQAQWKETGIGALGGAGLGALLGYLTPRDKDESKVDRFLRYILGGAAMGGIAGLGYGSSKDFFGSGGGSNGGSSVDKKPPEPNNPSWLPQRATNTAARALEGAAAGEGASWGAYGLGRLWDRYVPRKDVLKAILTHPKNWKSKLEELAYERAEAALKAGKLTEEQAKTFITGTLPGATSSEINLSKAVAREAARATRPKASPLTVAFRPRLKNLGKGLSEADKALAEAEEATHLGIGVGDLARSGGGRKLLRVLGPAAGALIGALEPTADQGRQGR